MQNNMVKAGDLQFQKGRSVQNVTEAEMVQRSNAGKGKVFPLHAMKVYWRSSGIAPVLTRMEAGVLLCPTTLPPLGERTQHPVNRRLDGAHSQSRYYGEKNLSLLPGLRAQTTQLVA